MYRKAGSQSALSGVPSGPYTGGRRVLDSARLEAPTQQRLARAIGGRADVSPIA